MDKAEFIRQVRAIGPTYFPGEQVQKKLAHVELVAIVGPTGVGKTSILENLDIPVVKTDITRPRREDEKKSETYIFRDDYDAMLQELRSGNYAQFVVSRSDEFYGTHMNSYPERGKCTMAIVAEAIPSFRKLGFKKIIHVYIMPPGYVQWMQRMGSLRAEDLSKRMAEAVASIKLAVRDDEYHFVLNDDLKTAIADVKHVIAGEELNEHRSRLARDTADMLLERLGDQDDDLYFENLKDEQGEN